VAPPGWVGLVKICLTLRPLVFKFFQFWLSFLPLFFPLYLVRFEVGGVPTTLLEILVGLTALFSLTFLRCGKIKIWVKDQLGIGWKNPLWFVCLFLIAATISVLIVPKETLDIDGNVVQTARVAQGIWKAWIFMPLVYFGMIYVIPRDKAWWTRTLQMLGFSGLILAFWALWQMITGHYVTMDGRASGPFVSANYLALYLGPIVFLGIILVIEHWRREKRISRLVFPQIIGLGLMLLALWGTQSYASFIALGAGLISYALGHPGISRNLKLKAGLLVIFFVMIFVGTQANTLKFKQFLNFEERTSSSVRIEVYKVALGLIKEHPILGIGLGQFETQYQLNAPLILEHAPYEWVMLHPHNLFLAFWLNTGLLGVLAMSWLVLIVFIKKLVCYRIGVLKQKAHFPFGLMGLAVLVMILVHGFFDVPFWKNDLAYSWWLVLGINFLTYNHQ